MSLTATAVDGRGRKLARLFRRVREIPDHTRACDLESILEEDQIELAVSRHKSPGYTACLIRPSADGPSGIILAPGQSRGRRRFSIAHELAHYHIPSHSRLRRRLCEDADMRARDGEGRAAEWEANEFAAELLMPRSLFADDIAGADPSFEEIHRLAEPAMYDVSVMAAALEFVKTTRHGCALVLTTSGFVDWVARSRAFPYRIPSRGDRISPDSLAAAVFRNEEVGNSLEAIPEHAWLENEQFTPVEVFESTHQVRSQSGVLSLIWVVPEDE